MGWKDHYCENIPTDLAPILKAPGDFIVTQVAGSVHRIHYLANRPLHLGPPIIKFLDFDLNQWAGSPDELCSLIQSSFKKIIAFDFDLNGSDEENKVITALKATPHCHVIFPKSSVDKWIADEYDLLLTRKMTQLNGFIDLRQSNLVFDVVACWALTEGSRGSIQTCQNLGIQVIEVDKHSNLHLLRLEYAFDLNIVKKKVNNRRIKLPNPCMQSGFTSNKRLQFLDSPPPGSAPLAPAEKERPNRSKISRLVL